MKIGNVEENKLKSGVSAESVSATYDNDGFYRLTRGTTFLHGLSITAENDVTGYMSVTTTYDDIHNITRKTQSGYVLQGQTYGVPSYDNAYRFVDGKPHVLDKLVVPVTETEILNYSNDANGNMGGYSTAYVSYGMSYDEEDRMTGWGYSSPGGGWGESYKYNDGKERRIKTWSDSPDTAETKYVNQFYTTTYYSSPGGSFSGPATKNIFVGNERVVSNIVDGNGAYSYYYSSDHLGSTGYLTNVNGQITEHIEYTPWGEPWVMQNNTMPQKYLFTGKEQDATGLYYYGARYYDAKLSMWTSADPGVTEFETDYFMESFNLNPYIYGNLNPLRFKDFEGYYDYETNTIQKGDTYWGIAKNDPKGDTSTKEWMDENPGAKSKSLEIGGNLKRPEHMQQTPKQNPAAQAGSFILGGAAMLITGDTDPFSGEIYNEGDAQEKRMNAAMFIAGVALPSHAAGIAPKLKLNGQGAEKIWAGVDSKAGSIFHYGAPGARGPHFAIGKTHFYKNGFWKPGMTKEKAYSEWFKETMKSIFGGGK